MGDASLLSSAFNASGLFESKAEGTLPSVSAFDGPGWPAPHPWCGLSGLKPTPGDSYWEVMFPEMRARQ